MQENSFFFAVIIKANLKTLLLPSHITGTNLENHLRVSLKKIIHSFCLDFPGSLSAMRFLTAVQEQEKDGDKKVEQVSRELWMRIWNRDKDITEPASLSEVPGLKEPVSI